jgi:hypothetical protein
MDLIKQQNEVCAIYFFLFVEKCGSFPLMGLWPAQSFNTAKLVGTQGV